MSARAVVDTITANVPRRRVALRVGNIALIVALAAISVAATPANVPVAIWWPAAGVSAWLTMTAPERQRNWAYVTVFAAVTLGCLLGGRAPLLSLAFGAAGTVEIALFTTLLLHRRTDARILGAADALRLAVVAAIASTTFGLLAATIAAVASPAADAWRTFISVALLAGSSHLSALLLITPLALLPDRPYDKPRRAEAIAQIVVTVIAVVIAFVIFTQIRLEFLVLLPLTWAGARFSAKIAQTEAVLVAFAVVALSLASWHPLAPDRYVALALATGLTAFLCTIAIITTAACAERGQSLDNARHALQAAEARTDAARTAVETLRIRYDLERQREDFLATTSHELRTPVTIIAGYTELLGETPDLPAQTRRGSTRSTAIRIAWPACSTTCSRSRSLKRPPLRSRACPSAPSSTTSSAGTPKTPTAKTSRSTSPASRTWSRTPTPPMRIARSPVLSRTPSRWPRADRGRPGRRRRDDHGHRQRSRHGR